MTEHTRDTKEGLFQGDRAWGYSGLGTSQKPSEVTSEVHCSLDASTQASLSPSLQGQISIAVQELCQSSLDSFSCLSHAFSLASFLQV